MREQEEYAFMKRALTYAILMVLPWLQLFGAEAVAQPPPSTGPPIKRITLMYEHSTEHCIHWWDDFTRIGALVAPDYARGSILPMLDFQVDRINSHTYKTHLGLIGRHIPTSNTFNRVFGWNVYYDYRSGPYHWLGLGMEMLGDRFDLRANAYIPFLTYHRVEHERFNYTDGFFAVKNRYLYSLYGINVELGWLAVKSKNFLLYAAASPYFFWRPSFGTYVPGLKLRIRPQFRDLFAIDLGLVMDTYCNAVFQAQFIFYIPLYTIKSRPSPRYFTNRQIYQPTERIDPLGYRCCWHSNF